MEAFLVEAAAADGLLGDEAVRANASRMEDKADGEKNSDREQKRMRQLLILFGPFLINRTLLSILILPFFPLFLYLHINFHQYDAFQDHIDRKIHLQQIT